MSKYNEVSDALINDGAVTFIACVAGSGLLCLFTYGPAPLLTSMAGMFSALLYVNKYKELSG